MRLVVGWLAESFRCVEFDCGRFARARSEWCERHHQIKCPPNPTPAVDPLAHRMTRPPSALGYSSGCLCFDCSEAYLGEVRDKSTAVKARRRATLRAQLEAVRAERNKEHP